MDKDIMEMYEEYLNEEVLQEIYDNDELEEIREETKHNGHSHTKFPIEWSITISDFVNNYLGVKCDCSNLFHSGLKTIDSDYVFSVSNVFANKNPELVYNGYLLLVLDAKGCRATYINPAYLRQYASEDPQKQYNILSRTGVHNLDLLQEYMRKIEELREQIENNRRFMQLLEQTNRIEKFKQLKRGMNKYD